VKVPRLLVPLWVISAAMCVAMLPALADGPIDQDQVLPLLRATKELTISTNPDGRTAYAVVPDTPAKGTADADRTISGQLSDGRWVLFVPLSSGNASTGDIYSLMWVWIDGRARFVGEIPAENDGLGQLSTSIQDGKIYIAWPTCCPREMRTKVNELDGIRLRLISDSVTGSPEQTDALATPPAAAESPGATNSAISGEVVLLLLVIGGLAFYFLPTLIAAGRRKRNTVAIFALNLLLGWSLIGWVISLVWSLTVDAPGP